MAFDPFDSAWQRWERAKVRMAESVAIWNEFLGDEHDAFDFSLDGDNAGTFILRVHQVRPTPPELALVFGEWLYNLRSALDYVIWATACHVSGRVPPPDERALQYPIYDTEGGWTSNLYRLRGLAEHHREMLLVMQPFNSDGDANYLGWLNRLARIDRHRNLVTGAARLAVMEPVLAFPDWTTPKLEWGERTIVDGRADVARITFSPHRPDMEVSVNPRIGIDPEIDEWSSSPFWSHIRFGERMRMIQVFVAAEIAPYEYDCTGQSRKRDLIVEEVREQMDERRGTAKTLRRVRPAVPWRLADSGKPSTRERLSGLDFPPDGPGGVNPGPVARPPSGPTAVVWTK